jgi:hypothetical protein
VHHEGNERHDHHHQGGERVDQKADLEGDAVEHCPFVDGVVEHLPVGGKHLQSHPCRKGERSRHGQNGDRVRTGATDLMPQEAGNGTSGKRQQRYQQQDCFYVHENPGIFKSSKS